MTARGNVAAEGCQRTSLSREFLAATLYLVSGIRSDRNTNAACDPRIGLRQSNTETGEFEMKNLLAFLGCGLMALAIGCGESPKPVAPSSPMDPAKMQEMMKASGTAPAASADGAADGDAKKEEEKTEEKKEEEKTEAKPEEKKEEEKKEDK